MGDTLILKYRPNGEVISITDNLFFADEYTVRYPDGSEEVVTGNSILDVKNRERWTQKGRGLGLTMTGAVRRRPAPPVAPTLIHHSY